jgi:hypothetical protein
MKHMTETLSRRAAIARLGGAFMMVALPRGLRGTDEPFPHPDPRPGITAANVIAEDRLPDKKKVRALYAAARENPEIFDGVYCTCHCSDQGHRSLLSCFESEQATGCWGCQEVAEEVSKLVKDGKSLKEIRTAVDEKFSRASRDHHS